MAIPAGAAQIIINYTSSTLRKGVSVTVWGVATHGTSLEAIAAASDTSWAANMAPLLAVAFTYTGTRVEDATEFFVAESDVEGSRSGAMSPPNVATLVHKITGMRGPGMHGQAFLPGLLLDGDVADDGSVDPTILANIFSGLESWKSDVEATGAMLAIVSLAGVHEGGITELTGISVDNKIASQRRRLRKGSGKRSDT